MVNFLADHCFDEDIVRAVKRRNAAIDIVLAREVGLAEAEDPEILAWAAKDGRVVLTHDRNTMIAFANRRTIDGEPMAGLVVVAQFAGLAAVIDDILILSECTEPAEWENRVEYLPL